jgi:hypothetical protein
MLLGIATPSYAGAQVGQVAERGIVRAARILDLLPGDAAEFAGVYGRAAKAAELREMLRASRRLEDGVAAAAGRRMGARSQPLVTATLAHVRSRAEFLNALSKARREYLVVVGHNEGGMLRLADGGQIALEEVLRIASTQETSVVAVSCETRTLVTAPGHAGTAHRLNPDEAARVASRFTNELVELHLAEAEWHAPDQINFVGAPPKLGGYQAARRAFLLGFWDEELAIFRDVQTVLDRAEFHGRMRARVASVSKRAGIPVAGLTALVIVELIPDRRDGDPSVEIVDLRGRPIARLDANGNAVRTTEDQPRRHR